MIPRAVFDCMVFAQALARPAGPAGACVGLATAAVIELVVSDAVTAEVRDVLYRPHLRQGFLPVTDEEVDAFLALIPTFTTRIDPVPAVLALARDPKDEKYLNLAVAARADYLVTRDRDLLDLTTGTDPDAAAFRAAAPGVTVLDPAGFLARTRPPAPPTP